MGRSPNHWRKRSIDCAYFKERVLDLPDRSENKLVDMLETYKR